MQCQWRRGAPGLDLLPEDILAAVLCHLVANVALSLRAVDAAVITVPATFGFRQRRATEAAATRPASRSHCPL